jgi:hypothetical protein
VRRLEGGALLGAASLVVVPLVDEVLDLGVEEQAGIDADLVVEAFDLEADDAVHAGPGDEAEQ